MFPHGENLEQKENSLNKYSDSTSKTYLKEIRAAYEVWKKYNMDLIGPLSSKTKNDFEIINKRVKSFSTYKDFLDQQKYAELFDSRSNLHSSALEEFMYYLFKDMVKELSKDALIGKSHALKDFFFSPAAVEEPSNMVLSK